jgi:hypothetical protein
MERKVITNGLDSETLYQMHTFVTKTVQSQKWRQSVNSSTCHEVKQTWIFLPS